MIDPFKSKRLVWRDPDLEPPPSDGKYLVCFANGDMHVCHYNKKYDEFDFVTPLSYLHELRAPIVMAVEAALKKALCEEFGKREKTALEKILESMSVWFDEYVENCICEHIDEGMDTGANVDAMSWCPLPEHGCPDEETGATIAIGALEAADALLPALRTALQDVLVSRGDFSK